MALVKVGRLHEGDSFVTPLTRLYGIVTGQANVSGVPVEFMDGRFASRMKFLHPSVLVHPFETDESAARS